VELYLHSPNTPSWRGAQLKHRDNFTFTLPYISKQNFVFMCCFSCVLHAPTSHFLDLITPRLLYANVNPVPMHRTIILNVSTVWRLTAGLDVMVRNRTPFVQLGVSSLSDFFILFSHYLFFILFSTELSQLVRILRYFIQKFPA
jgi:hypothetical protein